ncbi:GNAT family N-acetyltransferase [Trueperella pyogenes]|uniref:GNAT family N-acetyltransferase n=1 Tax=Trueperella pyogenes TaxID=1661 RepID=UPI00345CDE77
MAEWIWTPLNASDAAAVHAIITAVEDADAAANRTTRREVESYFAGSHAWRAQGAWAGNELVAFGLARTPVDNAGDVPITISGGVAPTWRAHGIGRDLLERQLMTARGLADELNLGDVLVQMYVDVSQGALFDMASRFGFRSVSRYVQLRRSLDIAPTATETVPYVEIVKMSSDWFKDARKARNRVIAENATLTVMSGKEWDERMELMEQDLCLVALDLFGDRPRLAGYVLASRFASDSSGEDVSEDMGDEGYIEEIVVLPEWRGKHLASSLLTKAMECFRSAGLRYIGLDVNVDHHASDSDVVTVFEHFNFQRVAETYIMTMTL